MFDPSLIFNLRELSPETIASASDKFFKSFGYPIVRHRDTDGVFEICSVESGDHYYEVVRMGWFVSCDCNDFKYKGPCKHVAACLPRVCRTCLKRPVSRLGDECGKCEMDNAPYLKPASDYKLTSVGNFRI